MKRRKFMNRFLQAGTASMMFPHLGRSAIFQSYFPITQLTDGAKQHWFGYYDKWQVDPTGSYALTNEVALFFRSPRPEDMLSVGLIDLQNQNTPKEIGKTTAWGWQQGCMLQWIPGSKKEVIWNARDEKKFVSKIYNIETGETRTLQRAVYTLSPDGSFALSVNFERLQAMRPGYGYAPIDGIPDNLEKAPSDDGIFKMDLNSGEIELVISYKQLSALARSSGSVADVYHWCNHLLLSPSGKRFIFLYRTRPHVLFKDGTRIEGASGRFSTRAITANVDGSDLYVLNDSGEFSHFIWKGDEVITAWAATEENGEPAFYEFTDKSKRYQILSKEHMPFNGHNTYVPNTNYEWILNDTYPQGDERLQELYLFHVPTKKKVVLGKFHEPQKFTGEWRCDLHPRCDQEGKRVFFDSTHNGGRRQMYMMDISKIIHG
ncbi:MAG: hypothetical protein AAFX53_16405 [Bacteroidota bacterium]